MKTFVATFALILAAGAASAFVIETPSGKTANLGSVKNCPGGPYDIQLTSGNLPDTINIPSTVDINVVTDVIHDLPMDLMCNLKLQKLDPFPLNVPCMNGLGSCEYDGCKVLESLCNTLPPNVPCKCPMPAGHYEFKDVPFKIPDMGALMDKLMAGSYKGEISFYSKATPSNLVGCFDMEFKLTAN